MLGLNSKPELNARVIDLPAVSSERVTPAFHGDIEASSLAASGTLQSPWLRTANAALLLVAALFFGLHFVHLSADFPAHSPWMDWSKYTDEGWYGDAAIRQIQRGHWYVRGDFNPAVALPVWPTIEFLLFSITGVSLVAARSLAVAVFGGILIAAYIVVRQGLGWTSLPSRDELFLSPAAGVMLLAVSPFCYAFTRMAILEPLLILLTLLALLAASSARAGRLLPVLGLGTLVPLMILTKTTAVFLLPSVAWMLLASCGYRIRPLLRVGLQAGVLAGTLWSAYFLLLVRPRYLEDYRYLFSANAYTGMTRENVASVLENTFRDGMWMGRIFYPLALAAIVMAIFFLRRCFQNPVIPALILWAAGYASFLVYHNNLQPRYYLVIAVPMTLLVPVIFEQLLLGVLRPVARGFLVALGGAMLLTVSVTDARETIRFLRTPEYQFARAAEDLSRVVRADNTHNPLLLSISGSEISLMTGLPSICDDFGTMALEDRASMYRPGWYATWNQVDDDKMDALSPLFHLERVASFMAYDDPERNQLILYRLDPPTPEHPFRKRHKAVPKHLQTLLGQQPSPNQLEH